MLLCDDAEQWKIERNTRILLFEVHRNYNDLEYEKDAKTIAVELSDRLKINKLETELDLIDFSKQ